MVRWHTALSLLSLYDPKRNHWTTNSNRDKIGRVWFTIDITFLLHKLIFSVQMESLILVESHQALLTVSQLNLKTSVQYQTHWSYVLMQVWHVWVHSSLSSWGGWRGERNTNATNHHHCHHHNNQVSPLLVCVYPILCGVGTGVLALLLQVSRNHDWLWKLWYKICCWWWWWSTWLWLMMMVLISESPPSKHGVHEAGKDNPFWTRHVQLRVSLVFIFILAKSSS